MSIVRCSEVRYVLTMISCKIITFVITFSCVLCFLFHSSTRSSTHYLDKDSAHKSILSSHVTVDDLICGVTGIYVRSTNHNATM
jgi:hypothetical protein